MAWAVVSLVLVNQEIVVAISNSFHVVFCLIVFHIPNFIQIGQKTEVKKIVIGRLWLVGPVSQKIAVFISNSFYLVFNPISAPKSSLIKIGRKTQKLKIYVIGGLW